MNALLPLAKAQAMAQADLFGLYYIMDDKMVELGLLPNLDAAKIAYDLVKVLGDGTSVGPILIGLNYPVHIMTPSSTVRRLVNASAIAVVDAQIKASESQSLLKAASS